MRKSLKVLAPFISSSSPGAGPAEAGRRQRGGLACVAGSRQTRTVCRNESNIRLFQIKIELPRMQATRSSRDARRYIVHAAVVSPRPIPSALASLAGSHSALPNETGLTCAASRVCAHAMPHARPDADAAHPRSLGLCTLLSPPTRTLRPACLCAHALRIGETRGHKEPHAMDIGQTRAHTSSVQPTRAPCKCIVRAEHTWSSHSRVPRMRGASPPHGHNHSCPWRRLRRAPGVLSLAPSLTRPSLLTMPLARKRSLPQVTHVACMRFPLPATRARADQCAFQSNAMLHASPA